MPRIGIYAGTFDPVHAGHIAFALQALHNAELDRVYFLPERRPRNKQHVEHFAHRVAMLDRALKPHPQFNVMELIDVSFSVDKTLPKLQTLFPGDQLVFLFGSDVVKQLYNWPKASRLLKSSELVIGLRSQDDRDEIKSIVEAWTTPPKAITMFPSYAPEISSGKVREALRHKRSGKGVLRSVERYSDRNWLYISLSVSSRQPKTTS
jgi:nicotinate-nucleotide adenylyltransferase